MRIAVLGCGNMGRAILEGLEARHGAAVSLWAYDKRSEATAKISGVEFKKPEEWLSAESPPEIILVAVKPQDIDQALQSFQGMPVAQSLWISIAAGIPLSRLRTLLGQSARIVRAMPNTPALIGRGVTAYAVGETCTSKDEEHVEMVLGACGSVVRVPESLMNAVTGLSGSGPAYVYLFIEGLIEAGVTAGLPYATARELVVQTVVGAAQMVREGGEAPAELKARVMSPSGTTVYGLRELERHALKFSLIEAVRAAAQRAGELGCG
ncbi:MAG: pyrroline-5-carboxylate reductase [Chitinivibrionales bacterium]|nr:pyrroline-5-carboxylate reductase [Chitinivibrionales bacterium]MBD3358885.1 pyrroline-5-carboxylate reductase [Chitinivibrionales bacterium]